MKKYDIGYKHKTANGDLVLLERLPFNGKNMGKWKCFCDKEWICAINDVINGNTGSCGCFRRKLIENHVSDSNSRYLTKVYDCIKYRIFNSKSKDYLNYGGRGISIDPEWQDNKSKFIQDIISTIGNRPSKNHQLDRIDVNQSYYLNNLRWVTPKENCNNKRNNKLIIINNQEKTITQWSEISKIPRETISNRIRLGWSNNDLLKPIKKRNYKKDLTDFKSIYKGIIYRCYNLNCAAFSNYGARGIKIFPIWKGHYKQFQKDILNSIGSRPSSKHQLDRIDNNGNYEPGNIRWATFKENANNKSDNLLITINEETKTCAQWAQEFNLTQNIILNRYYNLKWTGIDLLKPPHKRRFNAEEILKIKNLSLQGLSNYKIAEHMQCGRKTIIDIIRGRGAYSTNICENNN